MDISGVSSALNNLNAITASSSGAVSQQIGIEMLDNAMDMNTDAMANITKMMELSVNPELGANFDMSI